MSDSEDIAKHAFLHSYKKAATSVELWLHRLILHKCYRDTVQMKQRMGLNLFPDRGCTLLYSLFLDVGN